MITSGTIPPPMGGPARDPTLRFTQDQTEKKPEVETPSDYYFWPEGDSMAITSDTQS